MSAPVLIGATGSVPETTGSVVVAAGVVVAGVVVAGVVAGEVVDGVEAAAGVVVAGRSVAAADVEATAVTAPNGTSHSPALRIITPPSNRADVTTALAVPPSELLNEMVLPINEPASIS